MATASRAHDTEQDIVKRGVKRTLPCKLTDDEFLEIARTRVAKEALRDQLETDFAKIKKRHTDQVGEVEDEIAKGGRELHSGEQDRTVPCNEYFRRDDDGTGWVHTIRMDTGEEVERRPATPAETQRYLPNMEAPTSNGPLLDQAAAAQGKTKVTVTHAGETVELLPAEPEDSDAAAALGKPPEDDGLSEPETSAQKSAREAEQARAKRRGGGGKNGKGK